MVVWEEGECVCRGRWRVVDGEGVRRMQGSLESSAEAGIDLPERREQKLGICIHGFVADMVVCWLLWVQSDNVKVYGC